jgi:hypothetical protein
VKIRWNTSRWPLVALVAACLTLALIEERAAAAEDDMIVIASAEPNPNEINNWQENFDQWVFPGCENAEVGRQRLETQVKMHLAEIERSCQLKDDQRRRIQLAARGDVHRYLDQVEALRRKFEAGKHDQQQIGLMWQEVQPLQAKQARGLTGPDSLVARIMPKTLTEEQSQQFDASQNERRRFRYKASIAVALHMLEGSVALTNSQRQELTKLLLELPPPRVFGASDQYLINYRLASLPPAAKLRQVFDARQWQALQQQFAQARGMRQHLIEQGFLPEDLDVAKSEASP